MSRLILFNKPYHVLSQFTSDDGKACLADYIRLPNIYPAGRLDYDSEGLMLLTDDGALQHLISHPQFKMPKTYWVQVEGDMDNHALKALETGVSLKDGLTLPAQANLLSEIDLATIWARTPPVRFRQNIPTSWLSLTIHEGRNRQVRRMTAAVGFPTLRLVRMSIGPYRLCPLAPGEYQYATPTPSLKKALDQYMTRKKTPFRRPI